MQTSRRFSKIFFLIFSMFILAACTMLFISTKRINNVISQSVKFELNKFYVQLKDINISYLYSGFGEHTCNGNKILITTLSRPNAFDLRMGVRNSWRQDIPSTFTHKFFIGSSQNETLVNSLKSESLRFGDIVFTDLIDSYVNLTLKMNSIYQWQQYYCSEVDYLLRADEDNVVDISRFHYWLNKEFNNINKNYNGTVIFGHLAKNSIIVRNVNEKWYVPYDAYNKSFFPNYVGGSSYLLTSKSVQLILNEAKNHKFITVDDAFYTGIIAEAAGITRIDSKKHFVFGNPLNRWNHECDENSVPLMFNIFDEDGEIEKSPDGYNKALKKLVELKCD